MTRDWHCAVQLRHIPMVHVMQCEGRGWEFSGNDEFYMHLRGNYALIRPVGELYVRFHDGDEYVWSTVGVLPITPVFPALELMHNLTACMSNAQRKML